MAKPVSHPLYSNLTPEQVKQLSAEALALSEHHLELVEGLPHIYGWKNYSWMRRFIESRSRECLLCCANQIGKSSSQIRKVITWATDQSLWSELWPRKPLQFWYLYPTYQVATIEFKKKWIPEFMPRGKFIEDKVYGWKPEWKNGVIVAIHFQSQVSVYFKTYAMDVQDLQTGSVDAIFLDEECPEELLPELQMRLTAKGGYFNAVFTPTLGQEVWRCAFEEIGKKSETYVGADKQNVSMYDCLYYEDGSRSPWTIEAIERAIRACKSEAQVQRRIYGRFVSDEGLKYPAFERGQNLIPAKEMPKDWDIFVGADVGAGGADNHPSAIVFVAVSPDRQKGICFKGWRGDDVITTAADVVQRVISMSEGMKVARIFYDWASKDFYTIAQNMGLNVEPAEKSHAVGEQVLNVLFRNKMLSIVDSEELQALALELTTLKVTTLKRNAKDDYCDALRYACTKIEWDWSVLNTPTIETAPKAETELDKRRKFVSAEQESKGVYEEEIDFWNNHYECPLD